MGQIKDFKKIILGQIIDHHDGKISVAESFRNIPFQIKKYTIFMILILINQLEVTTRIKI